MCLKKKNNEAISITNPIPFKAINILTNRIYREDRDIPSRFRLGIPLRNF